MCITRSKLDEILRFSNNIWVLLRFFWIFDYLLFKMNDIFWNDSPLAYSWMPNTWDGSGDGELLNEFRNLIFRKWKVGLETIIKSIDYKLKISEKIRRKKQISGDFINSGKILSERKFSKKNRIEISKIKFVWNFLRPNFIAFFYTILLNFSM